MTTPTPQTRFATHRHHRLAYELVPASKSGSPTHSDSPPPTLVLLHSLLAGRAEFTPLRDALTGHVRLILPDARGHGASAAIPDQRYTIAIAVAELAAILTNAAAPRIHLLGHDLGAAVALAFALANPAQVQSLSLIDPAISTILNKDPDPEVSALAAESGRIDALAADTAYKGVTDRALDQYLTPRRGPDWRNTTPRPLAAAIRRHATALSGALPALTTYTPDPATLATLDIPTVVYLTASARPITHAISTRLTTLIPNARLTALPPPDTQSDPHQSAPTPLAGNAAISLATALFDAIQELLNSSSFQLDDRISLRTKASPP